MKIEVNLADKKTSYIIKNMYPLYLHDISGIHGTKPNQHGILEEDDTKTLAEQYDEQQDWFEHPEELFPYLIMVDDLPAGFCLVGSGKYAPREVDYFIYETFLLSVYRGRINMKEIIHEILDQHKGKWMFFTHSTDNNEKAKKFWHKTVDSYTKNNYQTVEKVIGDLPKLVFTFEN